MPDPDKPKDADIDDQPSSDGEQLTDSAKVQTDSDVSTLGASNAEADGGGDEPEHVPPDLVPAPDPDEQTKDEDQDTPFDDEKTDQAIDEIVAKEGDDLLAVQDAAAATGGIKVARKGGFWRNKWVRLVICVVLFGGIVAVGVVPKARYWALNAVGVRSTSSVVVVDSTTQLPLKGVHISIGDKKADTDGNGKAKLTGLRLGPSRLVINGVGFSEIKRDVIIGWGSNPFDTFMLKATGVRRIITVTDYLSEKPIEGVEATDGQATAISGKDGKITLTLESAVVTEGGIAVSRPGYRTENITLNEDPKKSTKVAMILDRKTVFVTKQNGKYDVYKSDLDGKNRQVLVAGTGSENSNLSLVVSPDGTRAAYVSTRDNKRDSSGFLLSSLTLINIGNGNTTTIGEAAQIQLIDWIGSRLVFQLGSSDNGAEDRYSVVSYNHSDNTRVQLATAKKLSAVMSAKGLIYYAVGPDAANPSVQPGLFRVGADGKGNQRVFDEELSTVLRSTYGTLSLQSAEGTWYSYDLANSSKTQVGTPASLANRLYVDNDARTRSLWIGQSALLSFDIAANKDATIATVTGLTYPLQWAGDSAAIYRVSSGSETANYAVSLDGGSPQKIADVTPTYGFSQAQ